MHPVDHRNDSLPAPSKPGPTARRSKIRKWLIRIVVSMVLLTVGEKLLGQVSRQSLRTLGRVNHSFVEAVGAANPFRLSGVFYVYLLEGEARKPPNTLYGFTIPRAPRRLESVGWVTILLRVVPGVFYTATTIVSEGVLSTLTALIALFLGFATVRWGLKRPDSFVGAMYLALAVPLIGSVFLWMLLAMMWMAGLLLGWLLVTAETMTYFGVVVTCIKAVVKEREDHITSKIIERFTGHK